MTLPKISHEVFFGLAAGIGKNKKEYIERKYAEMKLAEPILDEILAAACKNCETDKERDYIKLGMLYTYLLYKAQSDSDDLSQWNGNGTSPP